ncbi:MAG: NPCBM/NEW2 domain-containing protein [Candidatus Omnitrophica bacterium]|nr:NPCBM/NEW2 domain-containing protein [Candidatus Omnitrophota bacterium]
MQSKTETRQLFTKANTKGAQKSPPASQPGASPGVLSSSDAGTSPEPTGEDPRVPFCQRIWLLTIAIGYLFSWGGQAQAESPALQMRGTPDERSAMRQWIGQWLFVTNRPPSEPVRPWTEVRRSDYHLGVRESVIKTPLRLGGMTYPHGLGSHSTSELVVHLAQPAQSFEAVIGVDENMDTSGGRGSVVFKVTADGNNLYTSGVMREGQPPIPLHLELKGARDFVLQVFDAGDGPGSDHGDWADAAIITQDGARLWLDEIPILSGENRGLEGGIPFSFTFDDEPSSQLLGNWKRHESHEPPANGIERHTLTWLDDKTGLEVACQAKMFSDFPAVEWVLHFKNTSDRNTPILQDVQVLNLEIGLGNRESAVFHYANGSNGTPDDYAEVDATLAPGQKISLPGNRKIAQDFLPYFNLEWRGGGLVGAIGWTGQWELDAQRNGGRELALQAGQQITHLKLLPGESIRTPRILLVHWRGPDRLRGHNLLRRLLVDHYVPRVNGRVVVPLMSQMMWFLLNGGNETTEQTELAAIAKMPAMGLEAYWLDAGWFEGGWENGIGNWFPRKDHFPHGLRPLGDAAHKLGLKFIVWFEPERVVGTNTLIAREHPEWLLSYKGGSPNAGNSGDLFHLVGNGGRLFNLGNPEARQWMTDLLSKCIDDWGIDVYRQDRNLRPFIYWRDNDPPDRQGITEIRHVEGLYAMWDELLRRHPGLIIDNANWRGTGPDLEVLMRSAGSWTCSEDFGNLTSKQPQLAGLSLYVPLHASCLMWGAEPYMVRSVARFGTSVCFDTRSPQFPVGLMKRASEEVKSLRQLYLGDYYPLLEMDLDEKHWCGWQFDRPDLGQGFAMLFRRAASPYLASEIALKGLDPDAAYEVTFAETYDVKEKRRLSGRELSRLRVTLETAPGSLLVRYTRINH